MRFILSILVCCLFLLGDPCFSQETGRSSEGQSKQFDKDEKVNDILLYYGWLDFSPGYYKIDAQSQFIDYHLLYQPFVSSKNVFQIDFGLVHADLKDGASFTPGDLGLVYKRNLTRKVNRDLGYSGTSLGMKFTIPTGRKDKFSGFNSWTIEPQVGFQWKIFNVNWLTSVSLKYNYSFASTDENDPRFDYLRTDYELGYENESWWIFFEPEYRYIPTRGNSTLYAALNLGYKPSRRLSVRFKYKPRVIGTDFFETYLSLGANFFFK